MEKTNISLLKECLTKYDIKYISDKIGVSVGTTKRWLELDEVPIQYTFDLYNILGEIINYSIFSSVLKNQFYTPDIIAYQCWEKFKEIIKVDISEYTFVEPSAGLGTFLKFLPKGSIGMDIEPMGENIKKQDYFNWIPDNDKKYIVFGNPPFGLRGHTALKFINHSCFADYICFILPQLFESDGKGSPRKRIKSFNLVYSEKLSSFFSTPENQNVKINCVFQIWAKNNPNHTYNINTNNNDEIKIYSLSDGGTASTTRNKNMLYRCDIYLPSTCFGKENMKVYFNFNDLPGKKGYGLCFTRNKEIMIKKCIDTDWASNAFLSTNSAYNIRTSLILQTLTEK